MASEQLEQALSIGTDIKEDPKLNDKDSSTIDSDTKNDFEADSNSDPDVDPQPVLDANKAIKAKPETTTESNDTSSTSSAATSATTTSHIGDSANIATISPTSASDSELPAPTHSATASTSASNSELPAPTPPQLEERRPTRVSVSWHTYWPTPQPPKSFSYTLQVSVTVESDQSCVNEAYYSLILTPTVTVTSAHI